MIYSAIISDGSFYCSTAVLQGPMEKILPKAKELGYDGVQLTIGKREDYDIPALKALLKENGLSVTGLATGRIYTVDGLKMAGTDPENRKAAVDRLKDLIDVCEELDGAQLIIGACRGRIADAGTEEEYFRLFEESVRALVDYAEPKKIPIILEVIDQMESDAYYKPVPTAEFVEKIGSPYFKMYLDTMHLFYENEDINDVCRTYGGMVPQVDISGEGRGLPMTSFIDFPAAMKALKEGGFDGVLTFEINTAGQEEAAGACLDYIKELMA